MANLRRNFCLYVSLLLVLLNFSISSARPAFKEVAKSNDLVSDVCSKAQNPSSCLQIFKSDPRSPGADLKGLGQISIDISQSSAKHTSSLISSLTKKATDPKQKEQLSSCAEFYDDAIDNLDKAEQYFRSGDYQSVNIQASAAYDAAGDCDDSFKAPPPEPIQLRQADHEFEGVCDIILVISNMLHG